MHDNSGNNKRIAKNTIFLYIRMVFVLVVSLYTSRVVLNTLGVIDFGVYNVVAGFVSMFAFLNATLSAAIQRFYNVEKGKNNEQGFKEVYTTSLFIQTLLAIIILLLLETFGLWYVNHVLVVPLERMVAAKIVFQTATISTIIVVMEIPYTGAIMAYEKMDFYAIASILNVLLKLALVLWLPHASVDKLSIYAVLMLAITCVDFFMYFIYSKKKFFLLRIQHYIDKSLFKSILSFSGWNLVGTFAFMLKGQGVNMLLNVFFGPIVNAARGIATQVRGAMSNFTSSISISFRPQLIQSYAEGNFDRTQKMMYMQSKICYALVGILIVPLIFQMDNVLCLWLGDAVPENAALFTSLTLVEMLFGSLNPPCTAVVHAVGDQRKYQIFSTIIHGLIILVAWLLLKMGLGPSSSFIVCIIFTVINQISCSIIACRLCGFSLKSYVKEVILPCSIFTLSLPLLPFAVSLKYNTTFWHLILVCVITVAIALPEALFVIMNKDERTTLRHLVFKK